jgi:hypothetical protein
MNTAMRNKFQIAVSFLLIGTALLVDADEAGDASVVGSLHLRREQATGQLAVLFVIHDALTAQTLTAARLVGAGAFGQVLVLFALPHDVISNFSRST